MPGFRSGGHRVGRPAVGLRHRAAPAADGWRQQTLPGKPLTHYRWTHKEGRTALQADSQQSASLWRKRLNPAQDVPQQVRFPGGCKT